jgi:hypothetical protein
VVGPLTIESPRFRTRVPDTVFGAGWLTAAVVFAGADDTLPCPAAGVRPGPPWGAPEAEGLTDGRPAADVLGEAGTPGAASPTPADGVPGSAVTLPKALMFVPSTAGEGELPFPLPMSIAGIPARITAPITAATSGTRLRLLGRSPPPDELVPGPAPGLSAAGFPAVTARNACSTLARSSEFNVRLLTTASEDSAASARSGAAALPLRGRGER